MDELYGNCPSFAAGQVISARAHLNALQKYIGNLRDDCLGVATPFCGTAGGGWVIRHRWNSLTYQIITDGPGSLRIAGTNVTGATWTGANAIETKTVSIAYLGLPVDSFYTVTISGASNVYRIAEVPTTSPPTLASFLDSEVPTAAQWQDLSDYAAWLADGLSVPVPLATRYGKQCWDDDLYGSFIHRARYLFFDIKMSRPSRTAGSDDRNTELHFRIDGGTPLILRVADTPSGGVPPAANTLYLQYIGGEKLWQCYLDMEAYSSSAALVYGEWYRWHIRIQSQYSDDLVDGSYNIYRMYETPEGADGCSGTPALDEAEIAGYTVPLSWTHGDYVRGTGGPTDPRIGVIKDNLETLGALDIFYNNAAPARVKDFLYSVRRRRWLLYRTFSGQQATVHYDYQGETKKVTLPEASTTWLPADLDAIEGLVPGMHYWVGGCRYAMEDVHA